MPTGVYKRRCFSEEHRRNLAKASLGNKNAFIHGGGHSRLYKVWWAMVQRCNDLYADDYNRYGGRGIYVIPKWSLSFENFRDWAIKAGYKQGLSIDRVNNDEGYMPQNCQWIPIGENSRKDKLRKPLQKTKEANEACYAEKVNKV